MTGGQTCALPISYSTTQNPRLEAKLKVFKYFDDTLLKPLETAANQIRNNRLMSSKEKSDRLYRIKLDKNMIKKGAYDTIKSLDEMGEAELDALLAVIEENEKELDLRNSPDSNP